MSLLLLFMCLANYGVSEAFNLCVADTWNIRNQNAPVILENKIGCSLTVVCASSFRPSQYNKKWFQLLVLRRTHFKTFPSHNSE
jgi:hypothetical protein